MVGVPLEGVLQSLLSHHSKLPLDPDPSDSSQWYTAENSGRSLTMREKERCRRRKESRFKLSCWLLRDFFLVQHLRTMSCAHSEKRKFWFTLRILFQRNPDAAIRFMKVSWSPTFINTEVRLRKATHLVLFAQLKCTVSASFLLYSRSVQFKFLKEACQLARERERETGRTPFSATLTKAYATVSIGVDWEQANKVPLSIAIRQRCD